MSRSVDVRGIERLRGYVPALAAYALATFLHFLCVRLIAPNFPGLFFVYLCTILIAAWCGYGPGIVVCLLVVVATRYGFKPGFSWRQVDPIGLAMLLGISLLVSFVASHRRRTERKLRQTASDLDLAVRTKTAELEALNQQLRLITDSLPVLISYITADQCYRFVNATYETWFGVKPEAMVGKPIADVLGKEAYARVQPHGEAVLAGKTQDFEVSMPHAGGERIIHGCYVPDVDRDGKIKGYFALIEDVTERQRAKDELRISEERLRLAQQAAGIGVWTWDLETNEITWTDEIFHFLGLDPTGSQPSPDLFMKFVHPDDVEQTLLAVKRSVESGEPLAMDFRVRREDGRTRWLLSRGKLYCRDGHRRLVGVMLDLTDRRKVEDELRRVNAELEQYAYAASHDLQEPLRMMSLYSQLLVRKHKDALQPEARDYLSVIEQGAVRMSNLVADLLCYSHVLAEKEVPLSAVSLDDVLDEALRTFAIVFQEGSAELRREPLPVVLGDRSQLVRLMENLISNAIKYRRDDVRIEITVAATRINDRWQVTVADNGQGIPPDHQARIFGVFKRLHGRNVPGTGMGLALCRGIVQQHGGTLWAESAGRDLGSRFVFTLAAADTRAVAAAD
ncbi:MAG TPA: ATP-binding protein [Bryobacteraceae bacterium]|nr:ATP-binding protein [Bryobacteraceae bacterium]